MADDLLKLKSKAFWLVGISVVALIAVVVLAVISRRSPGLYDQGWLATSDGVFTEGAPLHCSGIEFMPAAQAIQWLDEHGYPELRILETRSSSSRTWEELPASAELKLVLVGPDNDLPADVYIATPGHPEYGRGYEIEVPPQECGAS